MRGKFWIGYKDPINCTGAKKTWSNMNRRSQNAYALRNSFVSGLSVT